nr:ABC transporter ATP-binding protein [Butyrivibrio sp.]
MKSYYEIVKIMLSAKKSLIIKSVLTLIFYLVIEAVIPVSLNVVIDKMEQGELITLLALYFIAFVSANLLLCYVAEYRARIYDDLGRHILWTTRSRIYEALWHSNYSKYVRDNKDNFKFVLTTETFLAYAITTVYSMGALVSLFTILIFFVIAFWIDAYVGFILIASVGVSVFISVFSGKKILSLHARGENNKEKDSTINIEIVDMVETTRTNGFMDYYLKKSRQKLDGFIDAYADSNGAQAFWNTFDYGMHNIIYVIIAGVLISSSSYTGGKLVTAMLITSYLLDTANRFQREIQVLIKNIPVFEKVMNLARTPIESGEKLAQVQSIIFDNVALKFNESRNVFKDVSFNINRGENVLVKGENGTGKSSILKMIVGLLEPSQGTIKINGNDINTYDKQSIYKEICYVSQDELFLNEKLSVYFEETSKEKYEEGIITKLCNKLRLDPEIKEIKDNGKSLSGGEKKKLLILKSMLNKKASVVIFDEVDAGLDIEAREMLNRYEKKLRDDPTVIFIKISHIANDDDLYKTITLVS